MPKPAKSRIRSFGTGRTIVRISVWVRRSFGRNPRNCVVTMRKNSTPINTRRKAPPRNKLRWRRGDEKNDTHYSYIHHYLQWIKNICISVSLTLTRGRTQWAPYPFIFKKKNKIKLIWIICMFFKKKFISFDSLDDNKGFLYIRMCGFILRIHQGI